MFLLGANTTESHPVFGAALKRAVKRGAKLIVCDPRRIELAARAHIHLQPLPGTDVALMNAMLNHILALGLEDKEFIAKRTHAFDKVREAVAPYTPERAETISGVSADLIRRAAEMYARGPRSSTLWAMGLTQHSTGTDIVTALLNLILATGSIGRWGAAMIPIRGQNNVQGASDVGAIPMVYTDYQTVTDPAIRHMFAETWGVPDERAFRFRSASRSRRSRRKAARSVACTSWAKTPSSRTRMCHTPRHGSASSSFSPCTTCFSPRPRVMRT
jgi:predicted molibdopterin-dependent oxidoreductase YjgC